MANTQKPDIIHLGILLVLLAALLGALVYTGIIGCSAIPGGCELYYQMVKGRSPQILIVSGEGGMGNASELERIIGDRDILGARASTMDLEKLSYGNMLDYDLVIVEHAKKICTDKLQVFQSYVASGGRLVWTGDAGTELCAFDSYLKEGERIEGGKDKILGPWARSDANRQISFDEFLGAQYIGNYCEFANCGNETFSGYIETTDTESKLTYGLSPQIKYVGDYAVVRASKEGEAKIVAVIDNSTNLLAKDLGKPWLEAGKTTNLGKKLPFIILSGTGGRVAYYSVPIETFVSDKQPGKYKALIEQMYYGMLYK